MKQLPIIAILFISLYGNSQTVPSAIQKSNIQEDILLKTNEFDSLLLFDKASYWNEDLKMRGIGFIDSKCYGLKIDFDRDTSSSYTMNVRKYTKRRIRSRSKQETIRDIKMRYLSTLHDDSLNLKTRTSTYEEIFDASTWTVLIIDEKLILKQSYAPTNYQKVAPTRERKYFIESVNKLDKMIK